MTQSLAQKRASDALEKITALQARGEYGKYTSYVSSLPAEIIMSGLGQAMALVRAKKLAGYADLYEHIAGWVEAKGIYASDNLIREIVNGSEADYIRAQGEVMAYLEWLKKFAVALLVDDSSAQDGEGESDVAAPPP